MSIKPLPEDVVAQIKSSTTITSINGVVGGLIQNSLDAGATKISISIDYSRGNCSVEDNGSGILPSEYASTGGLGKLHCGWLHRNSFIHDQQAHISADTSRFPAHPSYYGSSGTFLASVAALSLITITSHHEGHRSHNSIKIHNSKVIARHTPSPPDQRLLSFSHGTRVTVRDLFGSMPVRVKQRALVLDRTTTLRDWENLKLSIIAILLAWPEQVSISIRETTSQQATVLRNTEAIVTQLAERARRSLLLSRISGLLCQASFFDDADPATWVALKASTAQLSITGAVCLLPVATKRLQFISIGIQPLPNIRGQNVLYEEINRMFASSSFGFEEETDGIDEEERVRRAQDRRFKTEEYTTRELRGKRGIDRHPMFYVHVDLGDMASYKAGHEVDEILDGRQSHLHTIVDVIKAMIHAFLKKHHFHPLSYRPTRRRSPKRFRTNVPEIESSSRDDSPGLSSSSIPRTGMTLKTQALSEPDHKEAVSARFIRGRSENVSHYNDWPKISSGSQTPVSDADLGFEGTKVRRPHSQPRNDNHTMAPTSPALFDTKGDLIRPPFLDLDQAFVSGDAQLNTNAEGSDQAIRHGDTIAWVNPITKQKCMVDARTGFVSNRANVDEEHGLKWHPNRLTKKVKGLEKPLIPARVEPSPWVEDLLTRWKNPVFEATEPPIPVAFDASALADTANGYTECSSSCQHGLAQIFPKVESRISRKALRNAEVIAQVDQKFILVKVSLERNLQTAHDGVDASLLVIIDQHAADERCKVEELMASYFNVGARKTSFQATTESLNKVIQYEIASHERLLFEQYLTHFKHWGIGYSLNTYPSVPQLESRKLPSFVKVSSLPPCIAERCLTEPRLLIDLMRKEVWKLNETCGGHGHLPHQTALVDEHDSTEQHWLSRFHGCPQGILDMINSRACRSAIMFNDTLSMGECKALLGRLAECAFPFQCAHGRPSMVPLVDMGNQQVDEAETGSFGKQFRTWQEKMGRRRRHS